MDPDWKPNRGCTRVDAKNCPPPNIGGEPHYAYTNAQIRKRSIPPPDRMTCTHAAPTGVARYRVRHGPNALIVSWVPGVASINMQRVEHDIQRRHPLELPGAMQRPTRRCDLASASHQSPITSHHSLTPLRFTLRGSHCMDFGPIELFFELVKSVISDFTAGT